MDDYDILYGVVIRRKSKDGGKDINKDIDNLTDCLGQTIIKQFKDIYVIPLGMELVEDDKKVRIINNIELTDGIPEK